MLVKSLEHSVKDVDTKKGIVTFYFASFNTKDSDEDIIMPGSYLRSIKEWGPSGKNRVKHLKNHNPHQTPGKPLEIWEDTEGALVRSQLSKTTLGQDTLIEYEEGIITEHSHGFGIVDAEMNKEEGVRYIKNVKLWEVSTLNAWGANENTPVVGIKDDSDLRNVLDQLEHRMTIGRLSDAYLKRVEDFYQFLTKNQFFGQEGQPEHQGLKEEEISEMVNYLKIKI